MPAPDLLDPKLDLVFKMQFARNTDLLIDLINAIRSTEPPIVDAHVINSEITPDEVKSKLIRLDILAQDQTGQVFDVEMQTRQHAGWAARSVFYLVRLLGGQLKEGEGYHHVRPVVGIHLLDFDLFAAPDQAVWEFELRDRLRPDMVLDRSLQLNMLELTKADRLCSRLSPILAQWITYFKHWNEEPLMQRIQHPPVQKAYQNLHTLSADKLAWYKELAREMARHDEATLREEKEEAERRGMERGMERGITVGGTSLLLRLLRSKFGDLPPSIEERVQTAKPAQLEHWADRVLFSQTLEQVFSSH